MIPPLPVFAASLAAAGAAPLDLADATSDAASGLYGDLDAADILLQFAQLPQPPYALAGLGLAIGMVCGLTFSKLVQLRLDRWKQDRLPMQIGRAHV